MQINRVSQQNGSGDSTDENSGSIELLDNVTEGEINGDSVRFECNFYQLTLFGFFFGRMLFLICWAVRMDR